MNSAKTKYSVTELELLASLFATKQFKCCLYGRNFIVHTDHRALKWLLSLQDPSSRLTRWAVKLSEYDYTVEHRPGTKMRHADALSRSVNTVEKNFNLSRDVICEEQRKDDICLKCKQYEHFWTDEDEILYYQKPKEQPRVVIPMSLVPTVLSYYHELPFTGRKYWWETMRQIVIKFIEECDECARRKAGHKVKAPLGEIPVAKEFLDIVSFRYCGASSCF